MPVEHIGSIRAERGFGPIPDAPGPSVECDVFFRRLAVAAASFDAPRAGQRGCLEAEPDPKNPARFRGRHTPRVPSTSPSSNLGTAGA